MIYFSVVSAIGNIYTMITFPSAITIEFQFVDYTTEEGETVEVCAVILSGSLERETEVVIASSDDSARSKIHIIVWSYF